MSDGADDAGAGPDPTPGQPPVPPHPWAPPDPTYAAGGYGPPPKPGGDPAWGQPQAPYGYGPLPYGYGQQENHGGATTSMVLGIVALSCLALGFFCCGVTAPGVLCAPVGWFLGVRAKRAIDESQGRYGNRGMAEAGVIMGVIGTILGVLAVAAVVAFFGLAFGGGSY